MRSNPLKEAVQDGEMVFGTFVSTANPSVVETIGWAGYDFAIIDMEHTPIDFGDLPRLFAAADATGLVPLVRVGTSDSNSILRVLDSGALGVVLPHVQSRADAVGLVRACRYPPQGIRAVSGGSRAAEYGNASFLEHVEMSNQQVQTIALIEDAKGAEAVNEIASVEGLDIIFPGPGDLSASLGLLGEHEHPKVERYVRHMADVVRSRPGLSLAYYISRPSQIRACQQMGVQLVVLSQDSRIILNAYQDALSEMRDACRASAE